VDSSIQRLLVDYAATNGVDPAYIDEAFQVRGKNAAARVRHIKGHTTHIHFRFHNATAEELGVRLARLLPRPAEPRPHAPARVAGKVVTASTYAEAAGSFAQIRARNGDTLVTLARRYGTTVEELQRVNGLRSNAIRAGSVYKIPQKAPPKASVAHKPQATVLTPR
jgi:LysM repeat protein